MGDFGSYSQENFVILRAMVVHIQQSVVTAEESWLIHLDARAWDPQAGPPAGQAPERIPFPGDRPRHGRDVDDHRASPGLDPDSARISERTSKLGCSLTTRGPAISPGPVGQPVTRIEEAAMSGTKIIAAGGATGAQGGGLVRAILPDSTGKFAVRALTRDPSSNGAQALVAAGAEVR